MESRYIGIDDKGSEYEVANIDWDNMTALCKADEWIGWARCRFEKFVQVK